MTRLRRTDPMLATRSARSYPRLAGEAREERCRSQGLPRRHLRQLRERIVQSEGDPRYVRHPFGAGGEPDVEGVEVALDGDIERDSIDDRPEGVRRDEAGAAKIAIGGPGTLETIRFAGRRSGTAPTREAASAAPLVITGGMFSRIVDATFPQPTAFSCFLAASEAHAIARARSTGSWTWLARGTNMAESRLPPATSPRFPVRKDTGTTAVSEPSGSSFLLTRYDRNGVEHSASTTSLTVIPSRLETIRISGSPRSTRALDRREVIGEVKRFVGAPIGIVTRSTPECVA
jgi:hypothetical protein